MKLSVCIITKNECSKLERCLQSLKKFLPECEIILVDTGSEDSTKEMALKYTGQVFDFKWMDDFSAARNFSVEKASGDWILILDSDEWILDFDSRGVAEVMNSPENTGYIFMDDYRGDPNERDLVKQKVLRFFNRTKYRFQGKIHEQIVPISGKRGKKLDLPVRVGHDGYLLNPEERQKKAERNIKFLKRELNGKCNRSYILYQLAKGYMLKYDTSGAVHYFELCLREKTDWEEDYMKDLLVEYGYCLLDTGQEKKALNLLEYADKMRDEAETYFLFGYILEKNSLYMEAVSMYKKVLSFKECSTEGLNSFKTYYRLACVLVKTGEYRMAVELLLRCGDYAPAVEMLQQAFPS